MDYPVVEEKEVREEAKEQGYLDVILDELGGYFVEHGFQHLRRHNTLRLLPSSTYFLLYNRSDSSLEFLNMTLAREFV